MLGLVSLEQSELALSQYREHIKTQVTLSSYSFADNTRTLRKCNVNNTFKTLPLCVF